MWNVKATVILGQVEATQNQFGQYLSNMLGKHEIKELQKTVILSNSHILREVLM